MDTPILTGSGPENATYEDLIDCLTWAVQEDYLPTSRDYRRAAALQIVRFLHWDPLDEKETEVFTSVYITWETKDQGD